jgi:excinuclease ABC subunit C
LGEILLQKMKREKDTPHILTALKRDLRLPTVPKRIECFDISNLQGADTVASLVVFENAKPKKSEYRKFIIEGLDAPDDFASMEQVITRRYKRVLNEKKPMPDLIMVDGGKGQLSSAVAVLRALGLSDCPIIGLAKRLEEIFLPASPDPLIIPRVSSSLRLLQRVRDEAHRFAVTFHRQKRSKRIIASELSQIKGIGTKTAEKLLTDFGSMRAVREADFDALAASVGPAKAKIIRENLENV